MRLFNFYLTKKELEALRKISDETGLSVSELIRRAVDKYIKSWIKDNAI